jgi:hypothetical protein
MHFLTLVGFGLIGYVPNTLYLLKLESVTLSLLKHIFYRVLFRRTPNNYVVRLRTTKWNSDQIRFYNLVYTDKPFSDN